MRAIAISTLLLVGTLSAQDPIAQLPPEPPAEAGTLVFVLDGAERPIAGADVLLLDRRALADEVRAGLELGLAKASPDDPAWRTAIARAARRHVTGEDGAVRVSLRADDLALAFALGAYAPIRVRPGDDEIRVRVGPRAGVEVVATDPQGRPVAGLPLWLTGPGGSDVWSRRARTDSRGRARLVVPEQLADRSTLWLRCDFVTTTPLAVDLSATQRAGTEPVELRLPELGQVRVLARDRDGATLQLLTTAALWPMSAAGGDPRVSRTFPGVPPTAADPGTITFGHVALGLELAAQLELCDEPEGVLATGNGPSFAGEMVILAAEGVELAPQLRMRVLDAAGVPLAAEPIGVVVACPGHELAAMMTTGAGGELEVRLRTAFRGRDDVGLTLLRRGRGTTSVYEGGVHLPLRGLVSSGLHELGEVRLAEEPVILAGKLVDPGGIPLAGVELLCFTGFAEHEGAHTTGRIGGDLRRVGFDHRLVTDAQGRFVMRQPGPLQDRLEISIHTAGVFLLEGGMVRTGDRDCTLVATRGGSIVGRLVPAVPEGRGLRVDATGPARSTVRPAADGSFELRDLAPGNYRLTLIDDDLGGTAGVRIDDLLVPRAGPCTDARVAAIEWVDDARRVLVLAVDPDGEPIVGATVLTPPAGVAEPTHLRQAGTTQREAFATLLPKAGARLRLEHPDHCVTFAQALGDECVVTMARRPTLTLRFANLPERPVGLRLDLWCRTGTGLDKIEVLLGSLPAEDDSLTIAVPVRGPTTLLLRPSRIRPSFFEPHPLLPDADIDFTVDTDRDDSPTLDLSLDATQHARLAAGIAQLR